MTTRTIKIIGLCSVSFLAGIGTGYLIGKRVKKRDYNPIIQEEDLTQEEKDYISNDEELTAEVIEQARKLASRYMEQPLEVYDGYPESDPYPAPEEDPYEEKEYVSILPYIITEDRYYNEKENVYDKVTLLYYSGDDTLVDENDEVVPNRSDLIGPALYVFTNDPEEALNIVYVRNEAVSCDFNIQHIRSKFSDYIGMPDTGSD